MKSAFYKNFLLTAVLVVLSFLILGVAAVLVGRSFALNEKRASIETNARVAAKATSALCEDGQLSDWYTRFFISVIAESNGNNIFITDTGGVVVSTSEKTTVSVLIGKSVDARLMEQLYRTGSFQKLTTLKDFYGDTPVYVAAIPVTAGNNTGTNRLIGYIFVCSDCTEIVREWNAASMVFVFMALIILAAALVFSYYSSKRQAKPLREMAAAARRFAHGDFSARVANTGRQDEIGELIESFNMMAEYLEKSEQLRSEFVANLSHELKTPMTTISGFADGILDGTIPKGDQDRYLAIISSETKRLSRLVRQMLEMSRIQSVNTAALLSRSFDLSEVIMRTLLNFETKITQHGLDVDAQLPEESIVVRGDADSYTQVVYNLLDNAIKFATPGTALVISLWKQNGKAFVSVSNQGETIAPDELPFLFDRFRKADKSRSKDREGYGLGLAIVKTILNNHDEDVTATSRDGVTEFIFTAKLK